MADISPEALKRAAKEIRNNQWDRSRNDVLDTAMQLWDARISVLVTRESLESAALAMARYIVMREAALPSGERET